MDQFEFDDLFETDNVAFSSSQSSLTNTAAQLTFCESDEEATSEGYRPKSAIIPNDTVLSESEGRHQLSENLEKYDDSKSDQHLCNSVNNLAPSCPCFSTVEASPNTSEAPSQGQGHFTVIQCIEQLFQQIRDALHHESDDIGLTLKPQREDKTPKLPWQNGGGGMALCFADRYHNLEEVLQLIATLALPSLTWHKRDIYYRDVALFGKQAIVDRYVDDLAFTFNVPRSALNVAAAAKGLLVGKINFCRRDGSSVDCGTDRDGMLIPDLKHILSVDMKAVKQIIVVEKEASFRSLAGSSCWETISNETVLITGKGYPDIATRAMLRFLSTPSPHNGFSSPLVFGLADYDPDGIAILDVYKHGSAAMRHENLGLKVEKLSRLGLNSGHIITSRDEAHADQGLLTLTARDRSKACKMLERRSQDGGAKKDTTRRELQIMLMLNIKAELQLLDAVPGGVSAILESAIEVAG
ncbi:hypothetical protein D0863_03304 [Hortaea werneckii]|uniref:DNA topoisomerase (ATP-hydrolyzing) n=1 Tax=Hortaea werneckii TaxID=91943 RepID=A0A3M7ECM7_HORWE|nr:hypothetical protein D0863_03304 [Hortaea werneckii]